MNVLFLTLVEFNSLQERNIYTDLLREFVRAGHKVSVVSPAEGGKGEKTQLIREEGAEILRLRIGNTQKTGFIKKGINTVLIEPLFKRAIKKYFSDVRFDLVLYSTPPITLLGAIKYVKKRDNAYAYLLLKDIFPQNAVDVGLLRLSGLKGVLYRHFRRQEKGLYRISDKIGCMSPANVRYVLEHNPDLHLEDKTEVCPNSISVPEKKAEGETKEVVRARYGLPLDKKVFVYGGNLGRPQGVPFIVSCLKACGDMKDVFFLIAGSGTDAHVIREYVEKDSPLNVKYMPMLPKAEYETLVSACDAGLLFLDYRFTIPNFPSRLLSYMEARLPVLACTDPNTDIGSVIEDGGFGWSVPSRSSEDFKNAVSDALKDDFAAMGERAYACLKEKYSAEDGYGIIIRAMGLK